jgi:uncharacterized membrane protein YbhN (UPF0104 family)
MNLFNGFITYQIAFAVSPSFHSPFVAVLSAMSIAWLCGFLAVFAPGGLMVREAAFAAMLLPWMAPTEALSVAVVARLAQFVAEAVTTLWVLAERAIADLRSIRPPKKLT